MSIHYINKIIKIFEEIFSKKYFIHELILYLMIASLGDLS